MKEREDIIPFNEPTIIGNMLLCGINPSLTTDKYLVIPVISDYRSVIVNEEMTFLFQPIPVELDLFQMCEEKSIYLTFITLGRNGEPSRSSQLFGWTLEG